MRASVASKLRSLRTAGRPALRTRGAPEPWTAPRLIAWTAILVALAESAWLLYPSVRARVLSLEETPAVRGYRLAAGIGCFSCHGPLGAGGVSNPGSFKGYIPGFWGGDFDELVRDDGELRQWIAEGGIPRISEHPIGRIFVRRQVIKMPAFAHGHVQSPEDIDALMAYLRWIRAGSWKSLTRVAAGG